LVSGTGIAQYGEGLLAGRADVRPIQPPIQWMSRALSLSVKRLEPELDHISPSSAEVKNGGAIPPILHYIILN
jgi:hypothetical protein